jgi:hypothetical protein
MPDSVVTQPMTLGAFSFEGKAYKCTPEMFPVSSTRFLGTPDRYELCQLAKRIL